MSEKNYENHLQTIQGLGKLVGKLGQCDFLALALEDTYKMVRRDRKTGRLTATEVRKLENAIGDVIVPQ